MNSRIAILGTGPSSLYAAYLLAHRGHYVRVYDPRTPWERPRGAGLCSQALAELPQLDVFANFSTVQTFHLVSPKGRDGRLRLERPISMGSREDITDFLQERVLERGIEICAAKFEGFEKRDGRWVVRTKDEEADYDFLIGGDGAASIARKGLGLISDAPEMTIEVSFEIPHKVEDGSTLVIRHLQEIPGCFWAVPSVRGAVVRLWATSRLLHARNLLEQLDRISQHLLEVPAPPETARSVAHLPVRRSFDPRGLADRDWAVIGDVAGFVNPLSQDGLYYGLKSAAALALSMTNGSFDLESFRSRLKDEILTSLARRWKRARQLRRRFLGFSPLERLPSRLGKDPKAQQELLGLFGAK